MKLRWFAFLIVLLAGCSSKHDYTNPPWNAKVPVQRAMQWMPISQKAGAAWGVDPQLITAIIAIESGGNPNAVSKSNAIGLMQLKASTSGRDVYRRMGWSGEPTTSELKNPERNISMGAAYLNILETGPASDKFPVKTVFNDNKKHILAPVRTQFDKFSALFLPPAGL